SVVTDVVGYPTHSNFNFRLYFWRYYLWVLFFPGLAAVLYHLLGRRWPNAVWPDGPRPEVSEEPAGEPPRLAARQLVRALCVGATLGVGVLFLDPHGAEHFSRDVLGAAAAYALLLSGAARLLRGRLQRSFGERLALLDILCLPLTAGALWAASRATAVVVTADTSVH